MKKLKNSPVSDFRLWYNDWVKENTKVGLPFQATLDVGKSRFWDYGLMTLDIDSSLRPTYVGNIEKTNFEDNLWDLVLCNGMYECVENPQKMVDEVMRILKPGGKAIFGFVGEGYKPYKKPWRCYKPGDIEFRGEVEGMDFVSKRDFSNQYHFIICQK